MTNLTIGIYRYFLMTGEAPDSVSMQTVFLK